MTFKPFYQFFLFFVGSSAIFAQDITAKKPYREIYLSNHECKRPFVLGDFSKNQDKNIIPKRIFQTWKTHTLPAIFETWANTWKNHHPDWEYELWDDTDNRNFIKNYFPWFLEKYDSFPKEIYRADIVRYFYLYKFGGLYVDLDFECLKNFDPIIESGGIIFGKMGDLNANNDIPNALMASPPKADFWIIALYLIMNSNPNLGPEELTGPSLIKKVIAIYQNENFKNQILVGMQPYFSESYALPVIVMPNCIFYSFDWNTSTLTHTDCSYARTWWTGSWVESMKTK
jgi:mannosyltransferase OCH1-like enzyme